MNAENKIKPEKRIGIFIAEYVFGSCCGVISPIDYLLNNGWRVDVFLYKTIHCYMVKFETGLAGIHILDSGEGLFQKILRRLPGTGSGGFFAKLFSRDSNPVIPERIVRKAESVISKNRYDCFIGVESKGLVFAGMLAEKYGVPLIYHSLELYLSDDPRFNGAPGFAGLKMLENSYHKKALATIIQDSERAEILSKHNGAARDNFVYVPVCLSGAPVKTKNNYFHKKFGLEKNVKILLYFGAIEPNRLSLEIAHSAANLPDGWITVFHGCFWDKSYFGEIERAAAAARGRIFTSLDMVEYRMIPEIISSADAGAVFYRTVSKNEELIGSSSTKLAHYFQCGLPVVGGNMPSLKKVIEQYGAGVCVAGPEEIPAALKKISENYNTMRENAFRAYLEKYEISKYYSNVINKIENDNHNHSDL